MCRCYKMINWCVYMLIGSNHTWLQALGWVRTLITRDDNKTLDSGNSPVLTQSVRRRLDGKLKFKNHKILQRHSSMCYLQLSCFELSQIRPSRSSKNSFFSTWSGWLEQSPVPTSTAHILFNKNPNWVKQEPKL